jgi:hypothetical protein
MTSSSYSRNFETQSDKAEQIKRQWKEAFSNPTPDDKVLCVRLTLFPEKAEEIQRAPESELAYRRCGYIKHAFGLRKSPCFPSLKLGRPWEENITFCDQHTLSCSWIVKDSDSKPSVSGRSCMCTRC